MAQAYSDPKQASEPGNRDRTTYACAQGRHGTAERRTMKTAGGYAGMYTGKCAGTMWSMNGGVESWCACECHGPVPAHEPGALPDACWRADAMETVEVRS